ncbi:hypothetical protein Ciccas_001334 [Cichlidogyrus casuarinus]|uniref:KY-like immunoglobulin-like domain-containing protein n=1 Tax=Cichlidogyrus casuarinus TaxID=1844966 RepID=A0ABD2QML6_9PLAT
MIRNDNFQLPDPIFSHMHPPPEPPNFLKSDVYQDPNVFEKIDSHAIDVSKRDHNSFKDLLWDLVYSYKLSNLERARVIFRWMTAKDMTKIHFAVSPPDSPEEIVLSFKRNKGTYARIYEVFCSYASVPCLTISGYAKGVDYLPGDKFEGQIPNHSWNAIQIQGSWQLVDAHWATRYRFLKSNRLSHDVVYEYDDFYFIMEPQHAIYSHFPEDNQWQLLVHPLTLNQFENLPLTKSQFFKCSMDFLEEYQGVLVSPDGSLQMKLGFLNFGSFIHKLSYLRTSLNHRAMDTIVPKTTDLVETLPGSDGTELKRYVLQETKPDSLNFYFRFPQAGIYYFTIYAQDLAAVKVNKESTFRAACEYKIFCGKGIPVCSPFPGCHDTNWGPSWGHIDVYGLKPAVTAAVIELKPQDQGRFQLNFERKDRAVTLLPKLRHKKFTEEQSDQLCNVTELSSSRIAIQISAPEPGKFPIDSCICLSLSLSGEYGLEVYANQPSDLDTFTHICQYLVLVPGWTSNQTNHNPYDFFSNSRNSGTYTARAIPAVSFDIYTLRVSYRFIYLHFIDLDLCTLIKKCRKGLCDKQQQAPL